MMTYCIGKCKEYKALKPSQIGRYAAGQKRCNYCEVFVEYDGLTCPCCNRQLRCLPRSRKGKEKVSISNCHEKRLIDSFTETELSILKITPTVKDLLIRNQY